MGDTACIVGATGLVGMELVRQLCLDAQFERIHMLVRRQMPDAGLLSHPKLVQHLVDFDQLSRIKWPSSTILFCCLGTTLKAAGSQAAFRKVDFEYVLASARRARRAGVTRLMLVSAMGADPDSALFYQRVKGETEAAVAAIGFDSVTIFRPSLLAGARDASRTGENIVLAAMKVGNSFLPKKYRSVTATAVARAMLAHVKTRQHGLLIIESDKILDYS